jgi:co-chaperonin GroES (HSP10)
MAETYELLKTQRLDDISTLKVLPNKVLVKFQDHTNKTVGGIITEGVEQSSEYKAVFSKRVAEVIKVPDKLTCNDKIQSSMAWEPAAIEIEPGDIVYFDHQESAHAQRVSSKGIIYSIVNYSSLALAKRGDKVIMLNGNILFSKSYRKDSADIINKPIENENYGTVRYIGKPNKRYRLKESPHTYRTDECDLKVGDRVVFGMPTWNLEDWAFASFTGDREVLRCGKRYMVSAVVEEVDNVVF